MRELKGTLGYIFVKKRNRNKDTYYAVKYVELTANDLAMWSDPTEFLHGQRGRYLIQNEMKPKAIMVKDMTKELLPELWEKAKRKYSAAKKNDCVFSWAIQTAPRRYKTIHEEWVDLVLPEGS